MFSRLSERIAAERTIRKVQMVLTVNALLEAAVWTKEQALLGGVKLLIAFAEVIIQPALDALEREDAKIHEA